MRAARPRSLRRARRSAGRCGARPRQRRRRRRGAMRPGCGASRTMRSDSTSASVIEWVTKITVLRRASQMRSSSSCSSMRVISSSAPNGSSISRISGSRASARAIATRCCMPPESSRGYFAAASARPTSRSRSCDRSRLRLGRHAACAQPNSTLPRAVSQGNSACCWKTTPLPWPGPVTGPPAIRPRRKLAASRPATMLSSVVLPQPRGRPARRTRCGQRIDRSR